jgi:putative ABC transport system permease protein
MTAATTTPTTPPPPATLATDQRQRIGTLAFVWQITRMALLGLAAHKMRTFLTMLGVIIGVAAVLAMMAIAEGASRSVESRIRGLGTNLIFVSPGSRRRRHAVSVAAEDVVSREDGERILATCPSVERLAPDLSRQAQIKYLNRNRGAQITGTTPEYLTCRNYRVVEGRFFNAEEVRLRRLVCVLGHAVSLELFEGGTPVGSKIKIRGRSFEVIGVLEEKGSGSWVSLDERVYIPISTAQKRLFGTTALSQIIVQTAGEVEVKQAEQEIDALMRLRYGFNPGDEVPFRVRSQAAMLSTMADVGGTFRWLFGGVAFVSLLVGGIGIMNIMLVSVTERTREIGIRMAVGAARRDVLVQFLIESTVLSISGGLIGLVVGAAVVQAMGTLAGWEVVLPVSAIVLAMSFSVAVGVFFGLYPASKAASLDPMEALRYE